MKRARCKMVGETLSSPVMKAQNGLLSRAQISCQTRDVVVTRMSASSVSRGTTSATPRRIWVVIQS